MFSNKRVNGDLCVEDTLCTLVCVVGYLESRKERCTEGSDDPKTLGKVENAVFLPKEQLLNVWDLWLL